MYHTSAEQYGIHKKNELAKPHINYESMAMLWYKTPNFDEKTCLIRENPYFSHFIL